MNYWLMKSEPNEFSIDDLKNLHPKSEAWEGIRNYQARNFIRDEMSNGDLAIFYHSSCKVPGAVGVMKINSHAYPDHNAFDSSSKYYDEKSKTVNPKWYMVDVIFLRKFKRIVTLKEMRNYAELKDMKLLHKGNRLSIIPITKSHYDFIVKLSNNIL